MRNHSLAAHCTEGGNQSVQVVCLWTLLLPRQVFFAIVMHTCTKLLSGLLLLEGSSFFLFFFQLETTHTKIIHPGHGLSLAGFPLLNPINRCGDGSRRVRSIRYPLITSAWKGRQADGDGNGNLFPALLLKEKHDLLLCAVCILDRYPPITLIWIFWFTPWPFCARRQRFASAMVYLYLPFLPVSFTHCLCLYLYDNSGDLAPTCTASSCASTTNLVWITTSGEGSSNHP